MMKFDISPLSNELNEVIEQKINFKTKPMGALGKLEQIARKIAQIQQSLSPELNNPHILVFAGDHGLANEGVSAFPQEVTHQMVLNFLGGGAAINVFCRQHDITLKVVDAGVNFDFGNQEGLINAKVAGGTTSVLKGKAMTEAQVVEAIENGAKAIKENVSSDCNVIGFGEMGIGNTSSSALIMHYITKLDIETFVGKGTGVNSEQLHRKLSILKDVIELHGSLEDPLAILSAVGGFEIAEMVGAYLQSASDRKLIIVDGFIATAAYAIAHRFNPAIEDYTIFSHQSDEKGHALFLGVLNVDSVLNLGLRLGEGTGIALAYPLIQSAVNFFNEMSSFKDAGVSNKE
ncbi:MAG: nicotinate-nucleotide--dimethylbenzimidazole phosphoribosyltransferase [Crocinitomicaceae bacterium]|nr:nicotinate-nucleotide--dimethylbenzimidazole phosphoribosyltransferase [Crocinitomicaceae bacterium]